MDNCSAISQPTATRAACGQRVTNDFHTSATRVVRGAGSRRVMSGRVFHASTAARDHTDTAVCRPSSSDGLDNSTTYGSGRVSQSTMPIVTISDQSVQTDRPNSRAEFNSAVSNRASARADTQMTHRKESNTESGHNTKWLITANVPLQS